MVDGIGGTFVCGPVSVLQAISYTPNVQMAAAEMHWKKNTAVQRLSRFVIAKSVGKDAILMTIALKCWQRNHALSPGNGTNPLKQTLSDPAGASRDEHCNCRMC